jgi:HK97 family phage prohead protease
MTAPARRTQRSNERPPRDGLVRLWAPGSDDDSPGIEVREDTGSGSGTPTLVGHFAVFNRWTEIDSFFEGTFMERIAPGAFKKTFREQRNQVRVLLNHGRDPQLGDKPIGSIQSLEEDDIGAAYEVPLFRGMPDLVMDGLRADQYGASFKFRVMREDIVSEPKASAENPLGLDERTIKEAQVFEFGPVTVPAYPDATAGLRSLTDDFFLDGLAHVDPELVRMAGQGMDLAGLIARRFGVSMPRGVEPDEVEASVEDTKEDEAVAEVMEERAEEQDVKEDVTEDIAAEVRTQEKPEQGNAAPEAASTPLIGPAGHRESWRL